MGYRRIQPYVSGFLPWSAWMGTSDALSRLLYNYRNDSSEHLCQKCRIYDQMPWAPPQNSADLAEGSEDILSLSSGGGSEFTRSVEDVHTKAEDCTSKTCLDVSVLSNVGTTFEHTRPEIAVRLR